MKIRGFQYTGKTISMVLDYRPISIDRTHGSFEEVLNIALPAINAGTLETPEVTEAINNVLLKYDKAARRMAALTPSVAIEGDHVLIAGEELAGFMAERLVGLVDEATQLGEDPGYRALPLARFAERLMSHPWNSENAGWHEREMFESLKTDLYRFLEKGKMPLTSDGCFLAYKAIDAEFYSIHAGDLRATSGTFVRVNGTEIDCTVNPAVSGTRGVIRNKVGDKPRIPLNMVNPDRNQTCSYGLHVCSFDYLPSFSHAGGHVMLCKVAPEDVGSIPSDYNDTKMRVCAYEVVDEYAGYYADDGPMPWTTVVDAYDDGDDEGDDEGDGLDETVEVVLGELNKAVRAYLESSLCSDQKAAEIVTRHVNSCMQSMCLPCDDSSSVIVEVLQTLRN